MSDQSINNNNNNNNNINNNNNDDNSFSMNAFGLEQCFLNFFPFEDPLKLLFTSRGTPAYEKEA